MNWINAKECTPIVGKDVLIYAISRFPTGTRPFYAIGQYSHGEWESETLDEFADTVTYWADLISPQEQADAIERAKNAPPMFTMTGKNFSVEYRPPIYEKHAEG